jgi:hypothetical protein
MPVPFHSLTLMPSRPALRLLLVCLVGFAGRLSADPLSKKFDIDFYRDVPSRNLKGLATRADGRLVAGPVLTELAGTAPADLFWCLEPTPDAAKWLVGTGPEGRIYEITLDPAKNAYTSREFAKLDDPQVFALCRLRDGTVLAGTSPKGGLYLLRDGKPVARFTLPGDSIFDFLLLDEKTALVATGNPGRIYRVDLAKFATIGLITDKITDLKLLADRGITLFGEIRDRNIRRLARFPDGRIVAGSAPKGNLYVFPREGGAPMILQENREAEVTDLLPQPNGDLYATLVYAGTSGESRINRPRPPGEKSAAAAAPAPAPEAIFELSSAPEKFSGRSTLVWFPANGFPETLVTRSNLAFYRLLRQGDTLLIAGGDSGDMLGYDLQTRNGLTFAGSVAAQLNGLAPLAGAPGRYLLLKNNAPGFALLDFSATGPREAETRRLDLGQPALLGALRFNRLRGLDPAQVALALKTNFGSDEVEGWTAWMPLAGADAGWSADALRGRYVKLRVQLPAAAGPGAAPREGIEFDKASLFNLPQNHRPVLIDFHLLSPNYGLIPATEPAAPAAVSIGQLLGRGAGALGDLPDDKKKGAFYNSQVVAQPGAQVVLWTVSDADGDKLACTFSLRRDGEAAWTDLAVATHDPYVQFDFSHLPEGVYFTRLVVTEEAPRPAADRLTATFDTDDLIIDRTPPDIKEATVQRDGTMLRVTVRGRDALSLLDGAEFTFNNGVHEIVEQPADGIRDSREETFVLEEPLSQVAGATSVEVVLYDAPGNSSSRRLELNTK